MSGAKFVFSGIIFKNPDKSIQVDFYFHYLIIIFIQCTCIMIILINVNK